MLLCKGPPLWPDYRHKRNLVGIPYFIQPVVRLLYHSLIFLCQLFLYHAAALVSWCWYLPGYLARPLSDQFLWPQLHPLGDLRMYLHPMLLSLALLYPHELVTVALALGNFRGFFFSIVLAPLPLTQPNVTHDNSHHLLPSFPIISSHLLSTLSCQRLWHRYFHTTHLLLPLALDMSWPAWRLTACLELQID